MRALAYTFAHTRTRTTLVHVIKTVNTLNIVQIMRFMLLIFISTYSYYVFTMVDSSFIFTKSVSVCINYWFVWTAHHIYARHKKTLDV